MANEKASKLANLAKLTARLREVETEHEASDDLQDLRTRMLAALGIYRMSRFDFGETLYAYKEALPHGAWLPGGASNLVGDGDRRPDDPLRLRERADWTREFLRQQDLQVTAFLSW